MYVHERDARVLSRITPHQSPAAITPFCGKRLFGPRAGYTRLLALEESGAPPEDMAEIHCPLGIEIGAVSPEEIAVSVLAQMIAVRHAVPPSAIAPMKMELPGRLKVRR